MQPTPDSASLPVHPAPGTHGAGRAKRNAILFVMLVCLCLTGIGIWSLWKARAAQLEEAGTATANMNRALAQHADDTLRSADLVLLGLVERLENEGTGPDSVARLRRLLRNNVAELNTLNGIFVYDEHGRWIVHSQATTPAGANNADREYFRYHQQNLDQGAHVGVPIESRSSGRWVIPLSRRINHPDGTFAGVALATIDMAYFRAFHDSFDIGANGGILLALDNGTLLVRRPFNGSHVGTDVSKGPVMTQLRLEGPGTRFLTS